MEKAVEKLLDRVELEDAQVFENMTVFPLCLANGKAPEYLTLGEAMEKDVLEVEEVDEGGSVPELRAVNEADVPVMLIDGEELIGAKQNRIVNLTILLKKRSRTRIPVSCTEHGRWSYSTRKFRDSKVVSPYRLRAKKAAAVSENMQMRGTRESDQMEVWDQVEELQGAMHVESHTSAMRDVYEAVTEDLGKCVKAFECLPSQVGMLVIIDGEVARLELVPRNEAYGAYHDKLVRSYAMGAMESRMTRRVRKYNADAGAKARAFLEELRSTDEMKEKALGLGWDLRYKGATAVGAALLYRRHVMHATFLKLEEDDEVRDDDDPTVY